jgi:putative copper export protein/mono/diheme cytochrome c family protein
MELVLCLARGTSFAAVASFSGFCWAASLSGTHIDGGTRRLLRRIAIFTAVLGLISSAALLLARACQLLDKPIPSVSFSDLWLVGLWTRVGQTNLGAIAILILACLALLLGRAPRLAATLGSVSIAVSLLASHAVAAGEEISVVANIIHVVAAGLWFGALPPLIVIHYRQLLRDRSRFSGVLLRFSRIALPLMIGVVATGVILATKDVATWPGLFATDYGLLLLSKIALVVAVILCAAAIRLRLLPSFVAGQGGRGLSVTLRLEFVLACLVALLAGSLSQTTPSKHDDIVWSLSFRIDPAVAWRTVPGVDLRIYLGGLALIFSGGLSLLFGRSGRWRLTAICAVTGLGAGTAIALPGLAISAYPTTYAAPPVAYDAATVARGRNVFAQNCESCHGKTGRGNGPVAKDLEPRPADLTAPHTSDHTMGDMFWWVSHGYPSSAMPGFADALSEFDRWRVVEYVMALSLGHQGRVIGDRVSAYQPWLHAIDFQICTDGDLPLRLADRVPEKAKIVVFVGDKADESYLARLAQNANMFGRVDGLVVAVVPSDLKEMSEIYAAAAVCTIIDMDGAISLSWNLYRRSFANPDFDDLKPFSSQIEYLVDRFGFVRARWRADEGEGLAEPTELIAAFRQLQAEPEINKRGVHDH